jgi:hypothetical protein
MRSSGRKYEKSSSFMRLPVKNENFNPDYAIGRFVVALSFRGAGRREIFLYLDDL